MNECTLLNNVMTANKEHNLSDYDKESMIPKAR